MNVIDNVPILAGSGEIRLFLEYCDLLQPKLSYKDGLSNIRNNLMGERLFFFSLIAENYRDQSHDAYEIPLVTQKHVSVFPPLRRGFPKVKFTTFAYSSEVCRHQSLREQFIEVKANKNATEKGNSTKCCFTYEISDAEERAKI